MMPEHHTLTKNQSLVFNCLSNSKGPKSAYELLDELRGDGLKAPLQIYRALEKLQEFDLVHRLESLNSFVACSHPNCHEQNALTAFAICEKCDAVSEFSDDQVEKRLSIWADDREFQTSKTSLEIRGICKECR